MLEYKIIMIELIRAFEFEGSGIPLQFMRGGPSLRPEGGLWLKIKRVAKA